MIQRRERDPESIRPVFEALLIALIFGVCLL